MELTTAYRTDGSLYSLRLSDSTGWQGGNETSVAPFDDELFSPGLPVGGVRVTLMSKQFGTEENPGGTWNGLRPLQICISDDVSNKECISNT